MATASFSIGGMHCAACAMRNERTLLKIPGVQKANVNLGTRRASVEFDQAAVSELALRQAVVENGYDVLSDEAEADRRARSQQEADVARQRAYAAIALTVPVVLLAMTEYALPWAYLGRNASVWIQAALSSVVILGLGFEFHRTMLAHARQF